MSLGLKSQMGLDIMKMAKSKDMEVSSSNWGWVEFEEGESSKDVSWTKSVTISVVV